MTNAIKGDERRPARFQESVLSNKARLSHLRAVLRDRRFQFLKF